MRIGYSYLYNGQQDGEPPSWFLSTMSDYMEQMLPAYIRKYLGAHVTIEPAPFSTAKLQDYPNWLEYFLAVHEDVSSSFDSLVIMVDEPYSSVSPSCGCAGENYYMATPNLAWTSVRNWKSIDEIANSSTLSQEQIQQLGIGPSYGINSLATAGHELLHGVLLNYGGIDLSSQIDGGSLSGMAFLDDSLNAVPNPSLNVANWTWVVQRIREDIPCQINLGGYSCETVLQEILAGRFFSRFS